MIRTVRELMTALEALPPDAPIKALWDCIPSFDVHRVEMLDGVAVIDCGNAPDGDWDVVNGTAAVQ